MFRFVTISALAISLFAPAASAEVAYAPRNPAPPALDRPQFAQPPDRDMPVDGGIAPARTLDRATVRAALLAQRTQNLTTFRAYQKAAVFPNNTYDGKIINVWRDDAGDLCAVATMVNATDPELVSRVADQNNFIRLGTVTTGPLMDWIVTSGFTQEEIALIQLPDSPVTQHPAPHPIERPIPVEARLRAAETARLVRQFKQVDTRLVKFQKASLELAVTRLMKKPQLAWALIDSAAISDAATRSRR